jgi:hypothetical protein
MYVSIKFKSGNKASFSQCGKEMVCDIGPVNEYEAQIAVIHFATTIIQKEYEL